MATISYIGIHHFGGQLTLKQLNALHKSEWPDMPSELRPDLYVGYNIVIWKDGSWLQARYIGEETCAQKGHNKDTVSICLAGNFTKGKDRPTLAQQDTLKAFCIALISKSPQTYGFAVKPGTVINIPPTNIFPHRLLQPNHTECYGSGLSDTWARDLVTKPIVNPIKISSPGPKFAGFNLFKRHKCTKGVRG